MSPSFNSFGSNPSVSQLVWDTDLVIPDGKAIESASGEVGIVGDVSISGSLSAEGNLNGINAVISGKQLLIGQIVGNGNVTLTQIPYESGEDYYYRYTSPDFAITGLTNGAKYLTPAFTYKCSSKYNPTVTFTVQAKIGSAYQTVSSCSVVATSTPSSASTQAVIIPEGATALRYTVNTNSALTSSEITSTLTLSLTPLPVY